MNSRDKILGAVKNNQPAERALPELPVSVVPGMKAPASDAGSATSGGAAEVSAAGMITESSSADALAQKMVKALEAIGGAAYIVRDHDRIARILRDKYPDAKRIVSNCPDLVQPFAGEPAFAEKISGTEDPHFFENIDLAVLPAHFGVAENGACWITEDLMIERVVPFICQHLALVIDKNNVVVNMHAAYDRIASAEYGFGTFLAGPSKTADIEQSLVLGAHGPVSMSLFLVDKEMADEGFF